MLENRKLKLWLFFSSRALSTFGDEVWEIALPIYLAMQGFSTEQMGLYSSFYATGTVVGFLLLPQLATRVSPRKLAMGADGIQLIVFIAFATALIWKIHVPIFFFAFCGLVLAAAIAIWFGASETLAVAVIESSASQAFHRLNYLSSTVGPVLAPMASSAVFFTFGLASVAVFNAATFIPQILAVRELRTEKETDLSHSSGRDPAKRSEYSNREILTHQFYGPLLGITSLVKVALVGALPFIPFLLAKSGLSVLEIGLISAAFPLGSFSGALMYRSASQSRLARLFIVDTSCVFLSAAVLIAAMKYQWFWLVLGAAISGGFFSARYTIEIRAMRQLVTSVELMPRLISIQGLFARVVTPLAGVLFGTLFSQSLQMANSLFVSGIALILGLLLTYLSARGFRRIVNECC